MFAHLKRQLCGLVSIAREKIENASLVNVGNQRIYDPLRPGEQVRVFAVGCGRSGTHFIACLMERDPKVASYHLDTVSEPIGDSFLMYCAWNELPVDMEGFFHKRQSLMDEAASSGRMYFEANPYLSFSVMPLFACFQAKFVFMVRRPEDVVNSHYVKGWYEESPVRGNLELSLGFQYDLKRANHFFGRIVPRGQEFARWQKLTRIGKIAWMWNTTNLEILHHLRQLPEDQYVLVKLEELDYDRYLRIHRFAGGSSPIAEKAFEKIRQARPGKGSKRRTCDSWSDQERQEFLLETEQVRHALGYN